MAGKSTQRFSFIHRLWSRQTETPSEQTLSGQTLSEQTPSGQTLSGALADGFQFLDVGSLRDSDLQLVLVDASVPRNVREACPQYVFAMRRACDNAKMGSISLRIGDTHFLTHFAGHIGYGVDSGFRGSRLAARSVRLLLPLARRHAIAPLWITCNPDNWASRRSCELAGAQLVETVDLPANCEMYRLGERQKCRYKIEL